MQPKKQRKANKNQETKSRNNYNRERMNNQVDMESQYDSLEDNEHPLAKVKRLNAMKANEELQFGGLFNKLNQLSVLKIT